MTFNRLPWWLVSKESACSAIDLGSISGLGRSPGEGDGNPLQYQYFCVENPMDRGGWQPTVHEVAQSWKTTEVKDAVKVSWEGIHSYSLLFPSYFFYSYIQYIA